MIVSIYNLQKVHQKKRRFDNFDKGFGYYIDVLQIEHSENGDYVDYRNAINHIKGFEVKLDRKSEKITIIFHLYREKNRKVYWKKTVKMELNEFEKLFRDFRKFQKSMFSFYEVYIKSIDKDYKYRFHDDFLA